MIMTPILICTYDAALLPEKKTPEAMCRDIKSSEDFTLQPGEIKLIKTWIKSFIPTGRCCKIYARSSLPLKNGLMLANSVGLVDSDYRGEYMMQLFNCTSTPVKVEKYTRLCQIEFTPHYRGQGQFGTAEIPQIQLQVDPQLFENFAETFSSERGAGGFGSTGKN